MPLDRPTLVTRARAIPCGKFSFLTSVFMARERDDHNYANQGSREEKPADLPSGPTNQTHQQSRYYFNGAFGKRGVEKMIRGVGEEALL